MPSLAKGSGVDENQLASVRLASQDPCRPILPERVIIPNLVIIAETSHTLA
ncbi:hypothetical protein Pd630_LPD00792 [Rhodococcus opacus PD630]|nr:hypothetical protein Pd630_LPD00792 [Rhodococcus opacus PD630]